MEITEEEVQKEARDCVLFKEEEQRMKEFRAVGTRESMLQEAKCLKQMYREMKAISRKYFLWKLVQELFDVSCQAYMSTSIFKADEKARVMKDVKFFCFHWTEDDKSTFLELKAFQSVMGTHMNQRLSCGEQGRRILSSISSRNTGGGYEN